MFRKMFGVDIIEFAPLLNENGGFIVAADGSVRPIRSGLFARGVAHAKDLRRSMASVLEFLN